MMMGPAPMMRMLWMSVRFGMRAGRGPSALGHLAADGQARGAQLGLEPSQHRLREGLEQRAHVVWPGAGLRVALEAEGHPIGARDALQAPVKERAVRRDQILRQARFVDRESVVLARDQDAPGGQLLHGVIGPMVPELHLHRAGAAGEREQLMSQADSKNGYFGIQQVTDGANRVVAGFRIAG